MTGLTAFLAWLRYTRPARVDLHIIHARRRSLTALTKVVRRLP